MGAENLAPTRIRSPDHPARSELLYLEVVCYIKKYKDSQELNIQIHSYNTRRKSYVHVHFCNTSLLRKSLVNTGIRLYSKVPDHIKKLDKIKSLKRELKSFLLQHAFYSLDEFVAY
jgi:metal-responsive CopG/Arc/MetJ family transcriptional regulator